MPGLAARLSLEKACPGQPRDAAGVVSFGSILWGLLSHFQRKSQQKRHFLFRPG